MTDADKQRCKEKAKVRQGEYREREKKKEITKRLTRVHHAIKKEYDIIKKRESINRMKDSEILLKRFHKSSMMTTLVIQNHLMILLLVIHLHQAQVPQINYTGDICSSIQKLIAKPTSPEIYTRPKQRLL